MTREEHLKYCKICMNQKFSLQQGVICGLTNTIADFENSCISFEQDNDLVNRLHRRNPVENQQTASQGLRFANFLLDAIFYLLFTFILTIIIGGIIVIASPSAVSFIREYEDFITGVFSLLTLFLYYAIFESLTGRSIGKYITKTKVVNENGEKPGYKAILLRSICRFIPFDAFSYLGSEKSGWHDKFSKTKVVGL